MCFSGYSPEHKGYRCYDPSSHRIHIFSDVNFIEDHPFFYNPSTKSSYSPTESTSLCLPPLSSSDNASTPSAPISIPPPLPPATSPPPPPYSFSKPPITRVFSRHAKKPNQLPFSSTTLASPDEPAVDDSNNTIDESSIVSDEL